jgi:hypothetical protein
MVNYLSLWIGNFGVEPWLATLFFLALPAFFNLNFLLTFVTAVLEAMVVSLCSINHYVIKNRAIYLSSKPHLVKVFLISSSIMLCNTLSFARDIKEIFISGGEQFEIALTESSKFSIGNKDVIKYKHQLEAKKLLIKGHRIGFSDLILWQGKTQKTYHIYVISKKEQLSKMAMAESLTKMGLQIRSQGQLLYVTGEIYTRADYILLNKIISQKHENLLLDVALNSTLRNELYAFIYYELLGQGANVVTCQTHHIQINCLVDGLSLDHDALKFLQESYFIRFNDTYQINKGHNFKVKLKIIQIETNESQQRKLGPEQISHTVEQLVQTSQILGQEIIQIGNISASAQVLVLPQSNMIIDQPALLKLGGEIPYTEQMENRPHTSWKFYGLAVELLLSIQNGKPLLKFKTELTSPLDQSIQGTIGNSSVYIKKGLYQKMFEVNYQVDSTQTKSIPLLNKIPLLKYLFTSAQKDQTSKSIYCYVQIEDEHESL